MKPITLREIVQYLPESNEPVLFSAIDRLEASAQQVRDRVKEETQRLENLEQEIREAQRGVLSEVRRLWKDHEIAYAAKQVLQDRLAES